MKVAIMQPYFLPYPGYFQLVAAVDAFVIYDDIKFTKRGWINRNRILARTGEPETITIPIAGDSDALAIRERVLAADFPVQRAKLVRRIEDVYRDAPFFSSAMPLVRASLDAPERNLFRFLHHTLTLFLAHLGIRTPVLISSSLDLPSDLRGQDRVIAICSTLRATCYVNAPGGRTLYDHPTFKNAGIDLCFLEPFLPPYPQFQTPFVPALSVIDALMFNLPHQLQSWQAGVRLSA